MPNFLKDMEIDEVSLVDEPATGKRFSFFKCTSEACLDGIKKVLGKQEEEEKPVEAREDLYMIKDPVPLEEEGSFRVLIGYGQGKEAPSDEEARAFCEKYFQENDLGKEIHDASFEPPMTEGEGEEEAAYIEGIVWTVEHERPAAAGAMGGGFTGATAPAGEGLPAGVEGSPAGGAPAEGAGEIQTRKQAESDDKQEHEPVDPLKQMRRHLRNATVFLDGEDNERALEELGKLKRMPEFKRTGHDTYLESMFNGDYRKPDIRDFIRRLDSYIDQQQVWNIDTGKKHTLAAELSKSGWIPSLENDPEALDYAMVLADEFSMGGVLDDYAQIEIYEMVRARFGSRKVSRFKKFLDDFKWWIVGTGLAYLILKNGSIMKADLMTQDEAEMFLVLDELGGVATFKQVMDRMGAHFNPKRLRMVMSDLAAKNYVAETGNGTPQWKIQHEYMKRRRGMRLQNPIQKEEGYQGWTNYETWNVALWAGNEEPSYRYVVDNMPYTAEKAEQIAREMYPEGTPDMDGPQDMDKVNWQEIAEAWNEE